VSNHRFGRWRPLQGAAELLEAAQCLRSGGYTRVETLGGGSVSINEVLGARMLELLDRDSDTRPQDGDAT
jgi:hypothetical protein